MTVVSSRRLRLRGMVPVLAAGLALSPSLASAQFSNIVFFGDSFTDTGNALNLGVAAGLGNPTPAPYLPGHFSNGLVWSELFATKLGRANDAAPSWQLTPPLVPTLPTTGNNYAVGGATTGLTGAFGSSTGMLSQLAVYGQQRPGAAPAGSLAVLWGGGNDITDAVALASPIDRLNKVQAAVTNLTNIAGILRSVGFTNFLIPYLPDLGSIPLYNSGQPSDAANAAIATGLTNTFNTLLGLGIQGLGAVPGTNAFGLRLDILLANIKIDAATGGQRYGVTNTTTPCFLLLQFNPQACNNALFVDDRHATTLVQGLIADAAYNRVVNGRDVTLLPEPSTVVLLAAGLMSIAAVARRRMAKG